MDATAIVLCRDQNLPLKVFNLNEAGALVRVVRRRGRHARQYELRGGAPLSPSPPLLCSGLLRIRASRSRGATPMETAMLADIKKDAGRRWRSAWTRSRTNSEAAHRPRETGLLEHVRVDYYGSRGAAQQVANVAVEDSRTLAVVPWEKQMVSVIEKAIMESDLGLNPATAGTVIRVPLPALTEERRRDLTKVVRHEGESARVAVRNMRRDVMHEH